MSPDSQPQPGSNVAQAVTEISERTSLLIREEIELAKTEVTEKVTKLVKGAAVGIAAGVFAVFGLVYLLHGFAWTLNELVFDSFFWGFFVVAALLFLGGAAAGYLAAKWLKGGSPPTPKMAIEEGQRIKATLTGAPGGQLDAAAARAQADLAPEEVGVRSPDGSS